MRFNFRRLPALVAACVIVNTGHHLGAYQPPCCPCPSPACIDDCSLENLANLILQINNATIDQNAIFQSGDGGLILRRNQVLYRHVYTPVNPPDSNEVTVYLPLKRFGQTDLYFYRLPEPNQPMGGWVPTSFENSQGDPQPYFDRYLQCNRLPQLSKSELNQIIKLFLPGCCCPIP